MRVLIDARALLGRFSGVARFITSLVDALAEREGVEVFALCGSEPDGRMPRYCAPSRRRQPARCSRTPSASGEERTGPPSREMLEPWHNGRNVTWIPTDFSRAHRRWRRRWWWERRTLGQWLQRLDVDVFHATWNTGVPVRSPVPVVLTVHDLIPWDDPAGHFATRTDRWAYRAALRGSVRRASAITTVSRYVRDRVVSELGADPSRVHVVENGVTLPPEHRRRSDDGPAYVLYVGGHESRKNVDGVFRTLALYWERYDDPIGLKLTGTPDCLSPAAAKAYEALPAHWADRVEFLGEVEESRLTDLYGNALCLLFLSRSEGFGLPVLEAMAHGCPVVAADRTALPEVVGGAGTLLDPDRPDHAADALRRLRTDANLRHERIRRGRERAARFTWARTADRMLDVYRRLLGTRPEWADRPPHSAPEPVPSNAVA